MKVINIIISLLLFVFINSECQENEFLDNNNECYSIETLLKNKNVQIDIALINHLGNLTSLSTGGYNIDFIKLDDSKLQSQNLDESKIYISTKCINLLENKLKIGSEIGIVMVVSNSNVKNINGIPERYFVIKFNGSGKNRHLISLEYDFSVCHEDPILLNMDININDITALRKKKKENADDPDIYENTKINIDRVLYAKKLNIDLFDYHSQFFEDICFKFKSENNTDVTLETRLSDYYQNITFCNNKENAHYKNFNYFPNNKTLLYCCIYGFFRSEKDKRNYIDEIDSKMNVIFTNSNFKVITCYKELLNYKNIVKNYGGIICLFVLLMQLIFFFSFCSSGTAPLENKIKDLISNVPKESPILQFQKLEQENNINSERKKFENTGQIDINNNNQNTNFNQSNNNQENIIIVNKIPVKNNQNIAINNKDNNNNISLCINDGNNNFDSDSRNEFLNNKKGDLSNNSNFNSLGKFNISNPPKKKKRKSVIMRNELAINDIGNNNNNLINQEDNNGTKPVQEVKKKRRRKSQNVNDNKIRPFILENINSNEVQVEEDKNTHIQNLDKKVDIIKDIKEKEKEIKEKEEKEKEIKEEEEDKMKRQKIIRRRSSQIFGFDNDGLNELTFDEARIFDKRHFCKYYCFMIQISNIIINTFCRCNDFNLFSIKLGLLLFLFPINLTFNAFFFTSKEIQSVYINKISDISIDWKNLVRSLSSSIISSIILVFLKLLCLTHHSIRKIKKEINIKDVEKKSKKILTCVKFRISIYYIFSLIFLLVFGFYVACFCSIFENTQLLLLQSMATSWALSLFYPFIICFFTTIFRICSLNCGKRGISCCYSINKLFQML